MIYKGPTRSEVQFADEMARAAAHIYSEIVDWYIDSFFEDLSDADWLHDLCESVERGGWILDAGAGPGNFSRYLVQQRFKVVSSDISRAMVDASQRLVPEALPVVSDMRHIPARDRAFDGLLCAYSLMHVPAPVDLAVLAEFARVLKRGGICQLMVKVGDGAHRFRASGVVGVAGHVQLFARDRLVQAVKHVGLEPLIERAKAPSSPHEFDHPKLMLLCQRVA